MTKAISWQKEALDRLNKAPFFIRGIAKRKVEKAARQQSVDIITIDFLERVKNKEMPE